MRITFLNKGETIVKQGQGTFQLRTSWKIGHLFLTDKSLFFVQTAKVLLEIGLTAVNEVAIERRIWLLGKKVKQLRIDFNTMKGRDQAFIALAKPETWVDEIKKCMILKLAERWGYNGANPQPSSDIK